MSNLCIYYYFTPIILVCRFQEGLSCLGVLQAIIDQKLKMAFMQGETQELTADVMASLYKVTEWSPIGSNNYLQETQTMAW